MKTSHNLSLNIIFLLDLMMYESITIVYINYLLINKLLNILLS